MILQSDFTLPRETLLLQSWVSTSQPRVVRHGFLRNPSESGGVPRRSWCCELGNFPRRCPLTRDTRARWPEKDSTVRGAELTLTCSRADSHIPPGPPSPWVVISWLCAPFHHEHQWRDLGLASAPVAKEQEGNSSHPTLHTHSLSWEE